MAGQGCQALNESCQMLTELEYLTSEYAEIENTLHAYGEKNPSGNEVEAPWEALRI